MSTCPTQDQLSRLALGTLSDDQMSRVASHIDHCAECEAQMSRLDDSADPLIANLRSEKPAPSHAGVEPGTVLGDYVIEGLLGAGGMGQVFRASHRRMKRDVALKVIADGMLNSVEAVRRFHREVEVAAKLVHPNIAMAYDAREHQGAHYLVIEYIDGMDLARLVKERGPRSVEEAVDLVLQAARGLAHAHAQGIIHRDIKPANLMLDRDGNVKVLDLGLSRLQSQPTQDPGNDFSTLPHDALDPHLTVAASGKGVLGTTGYLAPEQAEHPEDADARADVYGLGCTLYFLLTGKNPLIRDSVANTLRAHREERVPPLARFGVRAPRGLDAILQRMLAKRPQDRLASMAQVITALQSYTSSARRRRKRMRLVGIATALASGVLAGALVLSNRQPKPSTHLAAASSTASTRPQFPFDAEQAGRLQAEWARRLGVSVIDRNTLGMDMRLIPPGEFPLSARRKIRVTRPFYMATCETTVGQFRAFVRATQYRTRAEREGGIVELPEPHPEINWQNPEFPQNENHPVVQIAYEDAAAFCEWLSRVENLTYRVPTEAQWEWAARAGTASDYYWNPMTEPLAAYAWVQETSGMHTHPVGVLKPNAWGLFDTHGNAVEWCRDYVGALPASRQVVEGGVQVLVDPAGPASGRTRILRGTAYRSTFAIGVNSRGHSDRHYPGFGFRISRDVAK